MDEIIYNFQEEIKRLTNTPSATGFMNNDTMVPSYIKIDDPSSNSDSSSYIRPIRSAAVPSIPKWDQIDRERIIKSKLTGAELELLNFTTFSSDMKTIQEYVNIIQKLIDNGVFDVTPMPAPIMGPITAPIGCAPAGLGCDKRKSDESTEDETAHTGAVGFDNGHTCDKREAEEDTEESSMIDDEIIKPKSEEENTDDDSDNDDDNGITMAIGGYDGKIIVERIDNNINVSFNDMKNIDESVINKAVEMINELKK